MTISFYTGKIEDNSMSPVYPMSWTTRTIYDWNNPDDEGHPNMDYRPTLDVNLSNFNGANVLGHLGFKIEDGHFCATITEFLEAIQKRADDICAIIDIDERLYVVNKVWALRDLCEFGQKLGATHIYGA